MKLWTKAPTAESEDFAGVRDALRRMPVPAAGEPLLARITASHRNGLRVVLPLQDPAPPRRGARWVGLLATAAAAAVIALAWVRPALGPDVSSRNAFGAWFAAPADAQARTARPTAPGLRVTRPEDLRPRSVTYRRTVRGAGAAGNEDIRVSLGRDVLDGAAVWRVVGVSRGGSRVAVQVDTTWFSTTALAPLKRTVVETPYRGYERIVLRQSFDGLHLRGEMEVFRDGAVDAHRDVDRTLPPEFAPYVSDCAPFLHAGVPMGKGWRGSASVLGWAVRNNDVFTPVTMRVDGEEIVRVPAGTFACWRMTLDAGAGHRQWYWVRQRDGIGVRGVDSTWAAGRGVREIVLTSEQSR